MSNKFKVFFDARMLGHSGIGNHIEEVLIKLSRKKNIELILLGDKKKISDYSDIRPYKIVHFNSPIYSLQEQFFYPKIEKSAILHIPHYNAPIKYLDRSIVVVHDLIHLDSEEFKAFPYRFYARTVLKQISKKAKIIVTVSEYTRNRFLKEFPDTNSEVYVIHNGINFDIFYPAEKKEIQKFKNDYRLPESFFLVVGIGKKHKNLDTLIRVLRKLWLKKEIDIPLVIAGTNGKIPEYAKKEIIPEIKDYIITMSYIDKYELRKLYSSAYCLIMPSRLEGFGFPLLEAMACGIPTISSNATSLPEIGGDAALYFSPENEDEIKESILKIVYDHQLRKDLIRKGLKQSRKFRWDKSLELFIGIYKKFYEL